jgi:hypothetical protein
MNHFKAVGCAALVSGLALIGQASGGDNALLKAPLMACPSDKTVIGGVNACGKIWKIGGACQQLQLHIFVIFAGPLVQNCWEMLPEFQFQFFQGI